MSNSQSVASPLPTAAKMTIALDEVTSCVYVGVGLKFRFTGNLGCTHLLRQWYMDP